MKTATEVIDRRTAAEHLPELLTVEEAAAAAGVSRGVLYELVRRGEMPCVRFGRLVRIPRAAVRPGAIGER